MSFYYIVYSINDNKLQRNYRKKKFGREKKHLIRVK